jgi:hypothetical protein
MAIKTIRNDEHADGKLPISAGSNITLTDTGSTLVIAATASAPSFGTPGSSAIGDTAAAGTATTVSRSDHVHGREAAGTPGASAVGDTAAAGVATTVARSDHRHSREAFGTPVNIDASLTSLNAGSLTTVARADHVHTVSKVPVLIASTTLGSNTATVTLSGIPQTFTNLLLQIVGSTTSANPGAYEKYENIRAQYSGDTSSVYYSSAAASTSTSALLGPMNSAYSNWASAPHIFQTWIANYSSTTLKKGDYSMCWATMTAGNALTLNQWANVYNSTTAITSIALFPTGGQSFVTGSKFSLYGLP